MGVFEMVVIIVAIGCLTGVATSYFEAKAKAGSKAAPGELEALKAQAKQSAHEMEKLKDRVRVLEKLVTDDDQRLAREIDKLGADDRAGVR